MLRGGDAERFVGRYAELAVLAEIFSRAGGGHGAAVVRHRTTAAAPLAPAGVPTIARILDIGG